MNGALRFVRYAHAPNALGLCGPDDAVAVWEHGVASVADRELRCLLGEFAGAWPYLQLVAGANGVRDPLDGWVVDAYWVGNALLDHVPLAALAADVESRFSRVAGARRWRSLAGGLRPGAVPHHSFHVLAVSPWVGLLRAGLVDEPLAVMDACRIRHGEVVAVDGGDVVVRTRRLSWDGCVLREGAPSVERAVWRAADGDALVGVLSAGDLVTLHWGWVCERVTPSACARLDRYSARALGAATIPG
jgi:hypothetical protein